MWPNSDQLALSEVSECGSFMAMGLRNGTVVVWDIYRGEGFVCVLHQNAIFKFICGSQTQFNREGKNYHHP